MQFEQDWRQSARLCKSNSSLVAWQLGVVPAFSFIHHLILFVNSVLFIHVPFIYCDKRVGVVLEAQTWTQQNYTYSTA